MTLAEKALVETLVTSGYSEVRALPDDKADEIDKLLGEIRADRAPLDLLETALAKARVYLRAKDDWTDVALRLRAAGVDLPIRMADTAKALEELIAKKKAP